ncbi:hypothetical protein QR680_017329 [Steinernema hermaphroditum]|uniref:PPM-type phosphatase domain-containing protein n=1 Tax=Steinernema hermaphroditum TaxID=289476 RepID=A0AA39HE57_9BILA|nr:hypothetical protein QR680_017329 [Steinernema hermaphroditum]
MPIDNPALEAELDRRLSGLSLCCQSLQQVEQDHSKKRKGEDRFSASPPRKCPSLEASAQPPVVQRSPELVKVARSLSSDDSGFDSDLLQSAEDVEDELESEDELGSDDSSLSEDDTSPRHIGRSVTFTISQKGKQLANFLGFEFHRHSSVKTFVYWRCTRRVDLNCPGRIVTDLSGSVVKISNNIHPEHLADSARESARTAKASLKQMAVELASMSTGQIVTVRSRPPVDSMASALSTMDYTRGLSFLLAIYGLSSRLVRFLLLRKEVAFGVFFVIGVYFYVLFLFRHFSARMKGANLAHLDPMRAFRFRSPQFLDVSLRDIPNRGNTWRWKHKNVAFFASRGRRSTMEDRFHYVHDPASQNFSIFGIFDGHGGQYVSQFLEENFATAIRRRLLFQIPQRRLSQTLAPRKDIVKEAIVREVLKIDDEITAKLDSRVTSFTGSTLIAAILERNRFLSVVNVGDSRAVACSMEGAAVPLSRDHKPSEPAERRRIENAGGFVSWDGVERLQGVLAVSRAFGDTSFKRLGVLTALPDVQRIDLSATPLRFLLVASDGFWDVFANQAAIDAASAFLGDPRRATQWHLVAQHLVEAALERGSADNVSLLVLKLTGAGGFVSDAFWNHSSFSDAHADVSRLNRITYAYIAPVIIASGIVGDILTVATLTHPLLRQSSIVYTYLTLLAMTDLLTHISVIPMTMWLLDVRLCSRASAFFYAHIGFPLANALMGASVWIVVFLTLSQYMAVCHPFHYGALKKRRCCYLLFAIAYLVNFLIHAPWASKKSVHAVPPGVAACEFIVCDRHTEPWYVAYEWLREMITRVVPFLIVAYLNVRILITYRNTKRDRIRRLTSANSQRKFTMEKSEKEEKRLFILLFAIIIVFFLCTIPAAPLTVFVADKRSQNLPFQVIRAVVNLLEFTKFALNFYFYCLINPDIRRISLQIVRCRKLIRPARVKGQPVTPISLYTRSTKSTVRSPPTDESSRRNSRNAASAPPEGRRAAARTRSSSLLSGIVGGGDGALYDQLTVIRESEDTSATEPTPSGDF